MNINEWVRQEVITSGNIGCLHGPIASLSKNVHALRREEKTSDPARCFLYLILTFYCVFRKYLFHGTENWSARLTSGWRQQSGDLTEQRAQRGRDVDTYHADWSTFQAVYIQQRVSIVYVFVSKLTLLHYWLAQITFTVVMKWLALLFTTV